jgi:hypothetical protein
MTLRRKDLPDVLGPLSRKSVAEVRADLRAFKPRYKQDWRDWMNTFTRNQLVGPQTVAQCRRILSKWQAVRSKTKGRSVRLPRSLVIGKARCLDDVLAEALPALKVLGGVTVRDVPNLRSARRDALIELWDVFRDLPTIGDARAVGITKAVKLVTGGRIGPAFDSQVRKRLGTPEPLDGVQWLDALGAVARDIQMFESTNRCRLEQLVDPEWQPIAVGRVYDMVFGPKSK